MLEVNRDGGKSCRSLGRVYDKSGSAVPQERAGILLVLTDGQLLDGQVSFSEPIISVESRSNPYSHPQRRWPLVRCHLQIPLVIFYPPASDPQAAGAPLMRETEAIRQQYEHLAEKLYRNIQRLARFGPKRELKRNKKMSTNNTDLAVAYVFEEIFTPCNQLRLSCNVVLEARASKGDAPLFCKIKRVLNAGGNHACIKLFAKSPQRL